MSFGTLTVHRNGCTCPRCDPTPIPCARDCPHVSIGKLKAGQHAATHRRRKRQRKIYIAPDGLGFLKRVVTEKRLSEVVNLSALTRFQAMLLGGTGPHDVPAPRKRGWRYTKIDKIAMEHYAGLPPTKSVDLFGVHTQAQTAFTLYKLALLAGVSPKSVVGALLVYGLEYLAHELRTQERAPTVAQPRFEPPQEPAAVTPPKTTPFLPQAR